MKRAASTYRCQQCGFASAKPGTCPDCARTGDFVALVEERASAPRESRRGSLASGRPRPVREVELESTARLTTGIGELDRVLGGGVVPGSLVLIGGDPGIGKSTLIAQAASRLAEVAPPVLYVSAEESAAQVRLRAERLGIRTDGLLLWAENDLREVEAQLDELKPRALVIDSIQTVYSADLEGAPGNVGQVRECAARLMRFAKETGTAIFVVGHVTKGGGIAGPKTLEHIVDTVLYFEGEGTADHRILRATKNRFGSVDEIGVFRMTSAGLEPVANPSELFVGERGSRSSGSALTALLEGSRPLLVEVQALAAKAGYGTAQRVSTGFDSKRLALLLAVLEKRAGLPFTQLDVFINVVGGIRITEPSADLAIAAALLSTVRDRALPPDSAYIGEIGLGGEIRPVSQTDRRIAEASNMGLSRVYVARRGFTARRNNGTDVRPVATVADLFEQLFSIDAILES